MLCGNFYQQKLPYLHLLLHSYKNVKIIAGCVGNKKETESVNQIGVQLFSRNLKLVVFCSVLFLFSLTNVSLCNHPVLINLQVLSVCKDRLFFPCSPCPRSYPARQLIAWVNLLENQGLCSFRFWSLTLTLFVI